MASDEVFGTPEISLDLAARRVVMASLLYYGLNIPMMPDGDYDALAARVAEEHALLTPLRQWMVGKPEEIAASGMQCNVTSQAVSAAIAWATENFPTGITPYANLTGHWRTSKRFELKFIHTNELLRNE